MLFWDDSAKAIGVYILIPRKSQLGKPITKSLSMDLGELGF